MVAIRMGQHLDYDHGEQGSNADTCEKAGQLPRTARFRVCGCVNLDQTERFEEDGGGKNANKRQARQHRKISGYDDCGPKPSVDIGIDVRESEISDQRPSSGTNVTAPGHDCDCRSSDGGDEEPRPAIVHA